MKFRLPREAAVVHSAVLSDGGRSLVSTAVLPGCRLRADVISFVGRATEGRPTAVKDAGMKAAGSSAEKPTGVTDKIRRSARIIASGCASIANASATAA